VGRSLVWKTVFSDPTSMNGTSELGPQVRALRHERGLTLKALGQRAGLSHPFLSQVERGLARPSVDSVQRIASALDVPVGQLWSPLRRPEGAEVIRRDDGERSESAGGSLRELAADPGAPVVREWTAAHRRWPPAAGAVPGEVLVYVARGAVEVDVGGTVHALGEGDAIRFNGATPHRLRRCGGPPTRALIVTAG
jgi:transcriptional regulator with XRE-family HTH domain